MHHHIVCRATGDERPVLRGEGDIGAEKVNDVRPAEGQELFEPFRWRTARDETEERVQPPFHIAGDRLRRNAPASQQLSDGHVHREQRREDGGIRAVVGICSTTKVRLDVGLQFGTYLVESLETPSGKGFVEPCQIDAVLVLRNELLHEDGEFWEFPDDFTESDLELRPGADCSLGVGREQLVVMSPGQFFGCERPDFVAEVQRAVAGEGVGGEKPREGRARRGNVVGDLRVVRNSAPRTRIENRFAAGGGVLEHAVRVAGERSTASFREQHHPVDECQSEPGNQHRFSRRHSAGIQICGVSGADVRQPMGSGELIEL